MRADAEKITDIEELVKVIPGLCCLVDVGEQQIQRPKRNDMQKSHYSGKKKRHTTKVQYVVSSNGVILQNTKHSPGSVHDLKVYKMKPPIFKLRVKNKEGKYEDVTLNVYDDNAYAGASPVPRVVNKPPIKKRSRKRAHRTSEKAQQDPRQDPNLRRTCHPQSQDMADNGQCVQEPTQKV